MLWYLVDRFCGTRRTYIKSEFLPGLPDRVRREGNEDDAVQCDAKVISVPT